MALTRTERMCAKPVLREMRQRERDYIEECEMHYRNGHRPEFCIHGTYQWTDYDNICPGCEDSQGWYEMALTEIRRRADIIDEQMSVLTAARKARFPESVVTSMETAWIDTLALYVG